ncbi:MAG: extracellular solute-binding protein family 1 [Bacillales bacterium]|jgi:tungstate transport system substrate-binding protein|nr:extracellular solute-binding protein family 1 [Bacillales bacterium]
MKKLMILLITLFLLIVGCSNTNENANTKKDNENKQEKVEKEKKTGDIILATTTSTQDSGLLDILIPEFEKEIGYRVKTIAVGTGKALEMGQNGEADVLLVHAPDAEKAVVDSGAAINRKLVMHNDFIIVGPKNDPAGLKSIKDANEAFKEINTSKSLFVSRGDDSGTHKSELKFWDKLGIKPAGTMYQETGQGMGETLRVASEKGGYTYTDRATFLALKDELNLDILVEGDKSLLNIYHVMQVNHEKFSKVNEEGAKDLVEFLVSEDVQKLIGEFGVDKYKEPLFFPDAGKEKDFE